MLRNLNKEGPTCAVSPFFLDISLTLPGSYDAMHAPDRGTDLHPTTAKGDPLQSTSIIPLPIAEDELASSIRHPQPELVPSPKKRGRPPGKKSGGLVITPDSLTRADVKKRRIKRRKQQVAFEPFSKDVAFTSPMFWTRDEFLKPDACLTHARDTGIQYVVGPEELERLGLPPIYDAPGWKHPDGSAFFSEDEMELVACALRERLELSIVEPVPAILFPFTGYDEHPAGPMTWIDAKQLLCRLREQSRLTFETLALPSFRSCTIACSEDLPEQVPVRAQLPPVECLPAFELRAVSLLLAKRLGYRPARSRVLEWTRVGDTPVAMLFDGMLVRPATEADGIPERWV